MIVSRDAQAAIGQLVVEVTYMEFLAAFLAGRACLVDNEMQLLKPGGEVFKVAAKAAPLLQDSRHAQDLRAWLAEAGEFQRRRHEAVHALVLRQHGEVLRRYHARTGSMDDVATDDLVALAAQATEHVDELVYLQLFEWPPPVGLADAVRTANDLGE